MLVYFLEGNLKSEAGNTSVFLRSLSRVPTFGRGQPVGLMTTTTTQTTTVFPGVWSDWYIAVYFAFLKITNVVEDLDSDPLAGEECLVRIVASSCRDVDSRVEMISLAEANRHALGQQAPCASATTTMPSPFSSRPVWPQRRLRYFKAWLIQDETE